MLTDRRNGGEFCRAAGGLGRLKNIFNEALYHRINSGYSCLN